MVHRRGENVSDWLRTDKHQRDGRATSDEVLLAAEFATIGGGASHRRFGRSKKRMRDSTQVHVRYPLGVFLFCRRGAPQAVTA